MDKKNFSLKLGDIPGILPSYQPGREKLNKEIYASCASYEHCQVMPLDDLLLKVIRLGHLEYKGKRYTMPQLLPDGLHLSQVASEYLADEMLGLLKKKVL